MRDTTVVVPVSATKRATELVERRGGRVELTATTGSAIMQAAAQPDAAFAGDVNGRFVLPGFMPAFGAIATFVSLLDLLAGSSRPLSEVVDALPAVHGTSRGGHAVGAEGCGDAGARRPAKTRDVDLVDGIRIHHDDGWVLVLPDPDDPVTHVTAEGDDSRAAVLVDEYARRIEQIVRP
ncbi:MAG: hypothetical protein R2695_16475 [Acidimicrobiales bacterium]